MKRTILFVTLALCAIALVSAQGNNRWGGALRGPRHMQRSGNGFQRNTLPAPEEANVSGNLTIVEGRIALVSDDTTYFVRGLNRYIGFIDGLKEGAAVSLSGYALTNPRSNNVKSLQVQKMTLNGKEYDFASTRANVQPRHDIKAKRNNNHRMYNQSHHRGRGMRER